MHPTCGLGVHQSDARAFLVSAFDQMCTREPDDDGSHSAGKSRNFGFDNGRGFGSFGACAVHRPGCDRWVIERGSLAEYGQFSRSDSNLSSRELFEPNLLGNFAFREFSESKCDKFYVPIGQFPWALLRHAVLGAARLV